jgi:hypothetical protein
VSAETGRRVFVLLAWDAAAGAAITPVGVLAVEPSGTDLTAAVSWLPLTGGAAWAWCQRLNGSTSPPPELLEEWLGATGTTGLVELDPVPAPTLSHLAEGAVEQIIVELAERA